MNIVKTLLILVIVTSVGGVIEAGEINTNEFASPAVVVDRSTHQNDTVHVAGTIATASTAAIGFNAENLAAAGLKAGGLCACIGAFRTGDRVVAKVDNPNTASGILTGHPGTVGCGTTGNPPILIIWDDWALGHNGNGFCDCPDGWDYNADAGWYVDCGNIAPMATASAQTVCGGDFWVGAKVRAVVNTPQGAAGIYVGREGRLVCGDNVDPLPILIDWDGWTQGHQASSYCNDPATAVSLNTNPHYWVNCSDVELASEAGCVCGGYFAAGARVSAAVNNPGGAAGISLGDMGTVVCGPGAGSGAILISWDNWSAGHNGNGFCECPVTSLTDNSGWYVGCDVISREHGYVFSDSFHTGDTTHWD